MRGLLVRDQNADDAAKKGARDISKANDELAESEKPDAPAMGRWISHAKDLLSTAILSAEVVKAAKKAFEALGMS